MYSCFKYFVYLYFHSNDIIRIINACHDKRYCAVYTQQNIPFIFSLSSSSLSSTAQVSIYNMPIIHMYICICK